jgi:hypothetical protein
MWSYQCVAKRQQILEEFKLGIWTRAQYIQHISALDRGVLEEGPSYKRQKTCEYSPDWDIQGDLSGSSQDSDDA